MFGLSTPDLARSGQFALLRAIWDLGLGLAEDAPIVMQEAMVHGHMADPIVLVAGLVQPTRRDNEAEISEAYRALVSVPFTREDALGALGRHLAGQVAAASDEDVIQLLNAVDGCFAALDYPGEPFSNFVQWADLIGASDEIGWNQSDMIERAREDARKYLGSSQSP